MAYDIPVVIGPAGLQPTPPATLKDQYIQNVTAVAPPGYTGNLPGSMIEDMTSTGVGGLAMCDQAKVETLNSLASGAANIALLQQLGPMLGVKLGQTTNTSVPVVFTSPNIGYVIPNGILVSDGTNVYQVQLGGAIGAAGTSQPLTAIAVSAGSWAVLAGTVNQIRSSIPSGITLTVNNTSAGTPGGAQEPWFSYRTRVIQALLAACQGSPRMIKTLVGLVAGVPNNLISVQQAAPGLRVCVGGGGDAYQIANAIFMAVGDPSIPVGSAVSSGRNRTISLVDYPDTYSLPYVVSPVQTITLQATWNTILTNFTGAASIPSLVLQPLADYINGLATASPINILELNAIFQNAVASLLDPKYLTKLVWQVYINGVLTAPAAGTSAVQGDPESSFTCATSGITVVQG